MKSVVNFSLKILLLLNRLNELVQIWFIGTSRGGPQILYKLGHCDLLNSFYIHFCENLKMSIFLKLSAKFHPNLYCRHLQSPRNYFWKSRSLWPILPKWRPWQFSTHFCHFLCNRLMDLAEILYVDSPKYVSIVVWKLGHFDPI